MNVKTENRIQGEIFMWYWNNFCLPHHSPRCLMFHVPNENQHHLLNIGVVSGVSDLVMIHKSITYFVEVKSEIGKQSPKQKEFQNHLQDIFLRNKYFIVKSLEDFKRILNFIDGEKL